MTDATLRAVLPLWAQDPLASRAYRFRLTRTRCRLGVPRLRVAFVMLNPSTADAERNDPTVAKCMRLALRWHGADLDEVVVGNLFAYRATMPSDLYAAADRRAGDPGHVTGDPMNLDALDGIANTAARVVCAWGVHGAFMNRGNTIARRLHAIMRARGLWLEALAMTAGGQPRHPLYLRDDVRPFTWAPTGT